MVHLVFAALLLGAIALAPAAASAEEQPGSGGGTIGKQGRSASGTPDAPVPGKAPAKPEQRGAASPKQRESGVSSCGKLVGVWQGPTAESTFKSNGTVTSSSFPYSGPWTCRNGQLVITWKDFGVDRCQLSADGGQMTCTNALGIAFARTRISGK
jgi:hypothetical protein